MKPFVFAAMRQMEMSALSPKAAATRADRRGLLKANFACGGLHITAEINRSLDGPRLTSIMEHLIRKV